MAIEYEKYIVPVALVVGGYLVAKKFGLFGSEANDNNNSQIDSTTAAGVNAALQAAQNAGDFATLSDSQIAGMASTIYTLGTSDGDTDTIKYTVIQCNTLTDLLNLIKAFGTKNVATSSFSTCALLGFNCTSVNLSGFLRATLTADQMNQINGYFSSMGINYAL